VDKVASFGSTYAAKASTYLIPGLAAACALVILFVGNLSSTSGVALGRATLTLALVGLRLAASVRTMRALSQERRDQSLTDELTGLRNRRYLANEEEVMAFPDRIERTVSLTRPPHEVWPALTTDGLSAWFGERATIDLRPGGAATMTFAGGMTVEMRIERVDEPAVFAYTWPLPGLPEDDPRRTYVEFTLQPAGDGTLLRVVETGFAQLPVDTRRGTYDSTMRASRAS
jgi:uncharacterized protein YndB with AHSA1/START domain